MKWLLNLIPFFEEKLFPLITENPKTRKVLSWALTLGMSFGIVLLVLLGGIKVLDKYLTTMESHNLHSQVKL